MTSAGRARASPLGGPRRRGRAGCAAGAGLLAMVLAAPVAAQEWHEDYRNGVAALRQGRGERAVDLLHRAINARPEPGVNVITYGTNVEERYFPYLRLAEAYLMTGHIRAARAALKVSEKYGVEPESERAKIGARVDAAEARARPAAPSAESAATPAPEPTAPLQDSPAAPSGAPQPAAATATPTPESIPVSPPAGRAADAVQSAAEPASPRSRPAPTAPAPAATRSPRAEPGPTQAPPAAAPATAKVEAALEVLSTPPRAEVYLDDERLGVTDPQSGRLLASALAPGRHRLRVALLGHADHIAEIELRAGETSSYRVALEPVSEDEAPLPFALLAVAGVVVAAGVGVLVWLRAGRAGRETTLFGRILTRARPGRPSAGAAPTTGGRAATPGRTPLPGAGETFGEYLLVEALGRGGMAVVYRAERRGETMALKRPLPQFLEEPEFLERFLREAEIGRTLYHPHIVRILERGEVEGVPYFTMELVPGETLASWLDRHAQVRLRRAAEIVSDVAEALDYAHLKGVVHRDLKPSNIMLLPEGTAKVMDYGIARARRFDALTATGAFLGTPDYVAPEIIDGRGSSAKSDLYALGVVFYELVAGRRPFASDTPFTTLRRHCTEPPPPLAAVRPGVPPELEAIVVRLLAKDPAERYDAEALLLALREWLNRAA